MEPMARRLGEDYKKALSEAGEWGCYMYMQGETIPKGNKPGVAQPGQKRSPGVFRCLVTDVAYDHNDELMMKDFLQQASETLSNGGVKDISSLTIIGRPAGIFMKWVAAGWERIPKPPC